MTPPRNLVICCDGTGNEFGKTNTNVVRIVRALARGDGSQRVYYDPGIGTYPEPRFFTRIGKKVSELLDLAFATGFDAKVRQAYTFLMETWEPGDQVFLFGFSRGAYTVRVLAGFLHLIGLLPAQSGNQLPYAWRLFRSLPPGRNSAGRKEKYWKLCDDFRETFGRGIAGAPNRHFPIRYLGVWDTVSSVGRAWDPQSFPHTANNPSIKTIRHAISLDERRAFFRQNRMSLASRPGDPQSMEEVWFPGVHSDVGGGYAGDKGRLWREPFAWIAGGARTAGLRFDADRYERVVPTLGAADTPWLDEPNESLTLAWRPAEVYPKLKYYPGLRRRLPHLNLGNERTLRDGEVLHWTVGERLRGRADYNPKSLSDIFANAARASAPSRVNSVYRAT